MTKKHMYKTWLIVCCVVPLLFFVSCKKNEISVSHTINPAPYAHAISGFSAKNTTGNLSVMLENNGESFDVLQLPLYIEDSVVKTTSVSQQVLLKNIPADILIENKGDYVRVSTTYNGNQDGEINFEAIKGDVYYVPFGDGAYIPSQHDTWISYLTGQSFPVIEQLSMPFFACVVGAYAVMYIIENPYRSDIAWRNDEGLRIDIVKQFETIDPIRRNSMRIYITDNTPVAVAKTYKNYIMEQNRFKTLAEKAQDSPNVAKLFGSPHVYLWSDRAIAPENIQWNAFITQREHPVMAYVRTGVLSLEEGKEAGAVFDSVQKQKYVDRYQKSLITRALTEILSKRDFYNSDIFTIENDVIRSLNEKEKNEMLSEAEIMERNAYALYLNIPAVFSSPESWNNSATIDLIADMKKSGIETAWIGLNDWTQAYRKPSLVSEAQKAGYLIAPYDSYHSIHKSGSEQWQTAQFDDVSLYEDATITNKNGIKVSGFQNVGRKLNPMLSLPLVQRRLETILSNKVPFNSWFIDCDATGEIYDDYSDARHTTKQDDVKARLERMAYIRDTYNMVIGSEGGNDFASETIAFAHGIELRSFSWMDVDMRKNKDSQYYMGRYYNAQGGVPEKFAKPVPIKERFRTLFLDMRYQVPLFKLVYNDSLITTYHWDWSTFKIVGEENNRMLRELLYCVPPLYHLDETEWNTYKDRIVDHLATWSPFAKKTVLREMTDFSFLNEDRSVQMTCYGDDMMVIANFSSQEELYKEMTIPPFSAVLFDEKNRVIKQYTQ